MTTPLKNQIIQGRERAKELLLKNNSAVSLASNQLFSVLESGEDSYVMRNHLDTILETYATSSGGIDYSWAKLRQCLGLKDKIAYVAGSVYGARVGSTRAVATTPVNEAELKKALDDVIDKLSKELINKQNFKESWMIRHAAFSNFECDLTITEQKNLSAMCEKMRKIAKDNGAEDLSEIMHFQKESDAQQIAKLKEAMAICAEQGIDVDAKLTEQFETIRQKIKPLEDLDNSYKHLMNTLNMVHRTGRKGFRSMINSAQQKKLFNVLDALGFKDSSFIFNAADQATSPKTIEGEYMKLKNADVRKFAEVLRQYNITQSEFERNFFSYFGFRNVEEARLNFDHQKQTTFGTKLKSFEGDVNRRRGMARQKVLDIHTRMRAVGGVMDFHTEDDYHTANSYFEQFKNIFFANEDDAFGSEGGNFRAMRDIVAAIVRRRVPAICATGKRTFGPALRRIIERMGSSSTFSGLDRRWNKADDAELVAMIIMTQNESANMLFYDDKNPFTKNPKGLQKLSANVGRTEVARAAVRDTISKPANTFARLAEGAVNGTIKMGNKTVSKLGRGATWVPMKVLDYVNRKIERRSSRDEKENVKRWATPIRLVTRSMEEATRLVNKGFTYTDKEGNRKLGEMRSEVVKTMQKGFKDKEINNIYQGFFHAFEGVTSLLGKSVSAIGNATHERIHTKNQRNILGAFFEAASKEEDLMTLMQSSDLASLLNLKESGPYLFDKDGRVISTTRTGPKEYSEDEAGANEYMKDQSKKIIDDMHAAFKEYEDRMEQKYDTQEESLASMTPADANYDRLQKEMANIVIQQETFRDKQTSISEMVSALQSFLRSGDVTAFESAINAVYVDLRKEKHESDAAIKTAQNELKDQNIIKTEKTKELAEINEKLSRLSPADKGYAELSKERENADKDRIKKRTALRAAEDDLRTNEADQKKLEKKRDVLAAEVKELEKKENRRVDYDDAVDKMTQLQEQLVAKKEELATRREKKSPEKTAILNAIKDLENHEKKLNGIIYGGMAFEDADRKEELATLKESLEETENTIVDNETARKKLIVAKDNTQDAYDAAVSKVSAIDAKLNAKMVGDKGYSQLVADRKAAETALEAAEKSIAKQEGIIATETQKGKVHSDIYKQAMKMQEFAMKMRKNYDDNIGGGDTKRYMQEVRRLLSEFNGYLLPKKTVKEVTDKAEKIRKLKEIIGGDKELLKEVLDV